MTEQSGAATEDLSFRDTCDRENEAPASMEQPVGGLAQSPSSDTQPKETVADSVPPTEVTDLEPASIEPPTEVEGADVIPHSDKEDEQVDQGWVDLIGDGKVIKRVLKAGSGSLPELHSVCLVHYVGKHKEDDSVFIDTKNEKGGEPVSVVAGRELVKRNQGINIAVARMLVGEVCCVEVAPEYGYGIKGSFSFPCVMPDARLIYELELVAASPPADKSRGEMFFEERLEAAQRLRLQGNELFRDQDIQGALNRNKIALDYIDDELLFQLQGHYLDDAHAVKAPLHLNSAACYLKLEDWAAAAAEASECLKLVDTNTAALEPKALFRRAKAYIETGRTEDAMKDLQKARQLNQAVTAHFSTGRVGPPLRLNSQRRPSDTLVVQEIARVRKQQKEEDAAVAQLFRNKLPAGSSGLSDPSDPVHADAMANDAWSSFGVFGMIAWFLGLVQRMLSSFGIRIPGSTSSNRPQST